MPKQTALFPGRRGGSRRGERRGTALEELINYAAAVYAQRDLAVLEKVPTPIRLKREGGAYIAGKATVDFIGVAGDHAIAVEAKSTISRRFQLFCLRPHQVAFLDRWGRQCAGRAYVVVAIQDDFYCVPWGEWPRCPKGPKSITRDAARERWADWRIEIRGPARLDFLHLM